MNITDDHTRQAQLIRCIPDITDYRTLLYIGANCNRMQMIPLFLSAGYVIDVVEVFRPNWQGLVKLNEASKIFRNIIHADIREYKTEELYDIVMWWHGPEHADYVSMVKVVRYLESLATKYVVLACPWGEYKQNAVGNNIYEEHLQSLSIEDFTIYGYQVDTIGKKDTTGSNLIAWKKKEVDHERFA